MKYLIAIIAAFFLVTVVTRSPTVKRWLHIILALLAVYAILKMTGVIEAIQPDRDGVF